MMEIRNESPNIRPFDYYNFYGVWPRTRTTLFEVETIDIRYGDNLSWDVKCRILGGYPYNSTKEGIYKSPYTL